MNVELLNTMTESDARAALLRYCGARRWAEQMAERRPFASVAELLAAAQHIWQALPPADWQEAFAAHPKIGDVESLRRRFVATAAWSAKEQAGIAGASETTLRALAEGNRDYEAKFGYIFIVCATGNTGDVMLALLQERLNNDPDEELRIAAGEQAKITRLRLERLCS